MMALLASIEQNPLSVWVRESPSLLAFPFILWLHTLGLAMLAGINVGLAVWLLARRTVPSFDLAGIYRVMWLGFGINAVSGLMLLAAYPAKALTNWVFFVKLALVAVALWALERPKDEIAVANGTAAREVTLRARAGSRCCRWSSGPARSSPAGCSPTRTTSCSRAKGSDGRLHRLDRQHAALVVRHRVPLGVADRRVGALLRPDAARRHRRAIRSARAGVAKGIAPATLHATLRWGVAGFAASVITGVMFISGTPDQYFYNDAFKLKVVLLVLMGANAALFYWREFSGVRALGPHDDAPRSAKIVAAASLVFLVGVMLCGRMITFFRPPF